MQLWSCKLKNNKYLMFPHLSEMIETSGFELNNEFINAMIKHLAILCEEFSRYFPQLPIESFTLVRDSFEMNVGDVPEIFKDEFIEMLNDSLAKKRYQTLPLIEFWVSLIEMYPLISESALRTLIPFPTTYLCENAFSTLMTIKTKKRNRLNVEDDLRCAISTTKPKIKELVLKKNKQT